MGADTNVRTGDLRVIETAGERSLAFVVKVVPGHLIWSPVHTYVEYATGSDLVVDRRASGLRYRLVVCTDIRSTALREQLDPVPVTRLQNDCAQAALRVFAGHPATPVDGGWWTGSRLTGPFDARWEFKSTLRRQVARHTEASLRLLLD